MTDIGRSNWFAGDTANAAGTRGYVYLAVAVSYSVHALAWYTVVGY